MLVFRGGRMFTKAWQDRSDKSITATPSVAGGGSTHASR
jgi:hypothetical protein